jgi:hypothetical protein
LIASMELTIRSDVQGFSHALGVGRDIPASIPQFPDDG